MKQPIAPNHSKPTLFTTQKAFHPLLPVGFLTNYKGITNLSSSRLYSTGHGKDSAPGSDTVHGKDNRGLGDGLTHVDEQGKASMVNVGFKQDNIRTAFASGKVLLGEETFHLVLSNNMKKGDVLSVAQLAGVMATKHTSLLIPLCHNIQISHSAVDLVLDDEEFAVLIRAMVTCVGKTGVEMEALTAVSIAALTVYDMCKAVSHDIIITDIRLDSKTGGKRDFVRKV